MNNVFFFNVHTNELIDSFYMPNPWKFEVGQVFHGFWECNSTVKKVELEMSHENTGLQVIQKVYIDRVSIFKF